MPPSQPLIAPRLAALARLTGSASSFRSELPLEPAQYSSGDDFRDLFSLDDLDELLSFNARRRPDFRVIGRGIQIPESSYTRANIMYPGIPDTRKLAREFEGGATIVMQGVQEYHGPLGEFARRLGHDLSRPVHVNAYITPPGAQGFGSHFDPRDAFIVQVEGCKDWTLREPALPRPLAHESWDNVRQRPGWDVARLEEATPRLLTLRPGDCLWLPRGWVHSARSGQDTSLHLTLSLANWTGHWAALELLSRAATGSARDGLPTDFMADPDSAAAVGGRVRASLSTWLDGVPDAELGEILRAAAMREFPVSPCQVVAPTEGIRPEQEFTVHPEAVLAADEGADGLTLRLADHAVTLPAAAAPLAAAILSQDRFSLKDVDGAQDQALCTEVLRLLLHAGILRGGTA